MSRFVNLEFGDESEDQSQAGEKALVKDEAYYFAEARTAFETGNFEQAFAVLLQGSGIQSAECRRLDRAGADVD